MFKFKPFVQRAVKEILGNAAQSALELNNFPLQSPDIQCAFDCYIQDSKLEDETRIKEIQHALLLLGFKF